MRKKIEWVREEMECVNEGRVQTSRVKVIGGWIVTTIIQDMKAKVLTSSSVFIEDKYHEWIIVAPIKESPQAIEKPVSEGF